MKTRSLLLTLSAALAGDLGRAEEVHAAPSSHALGVRPVTDPVQSASAADLLFLDDDLGYGYGYGYGETVSPPTVQPTVVSPLPTATPLPSARPTVTPVPTSPYSVASFSELSSVIDDGGQTVAHVEGHIVFYTALTIETDRALALISEDGAQLDGNEWSQLFYVKGVLELRGMTLMRGSGMTCAQATGLRWEDDDDDETGSSRFHDGDSSISCTPANTMGGAVRIYKSGFLLLKSCVVRDNFAIVSSNCARREFLCAMRE